MMLKLSVPWAAPPWLSVSNFHPLLMSMLQNTDEVFFDDRLAASTPARRSRARRRARELQAALLKLGTEQDVDRFLATRGIEEQAAIPDEVAGAFLPNTPLTLGQLPYAIELEQIGDLWLTLHSTADPAVDVLASPFLPMLRYLLEQDHCRVIVTHMPRTKESIERVFRNRSIDQKTAYVPLGSDYEPRPASNLRDPDRLTIFFNNSFSYAPNFFTRGGMEAIYAFRRLCDRFPESRMTVAAAIPDIVQDRVQEVLRVTPGLTLIEERLSDDDMFRLHCEADAAIIASLTLHSHSTVRAMAVGAIPIVCPSPGYENFIRDGETGIFVNRTLERSWYDPRSLALKRSVSMADRFDQGLCDNLLRAMVRLAESRELRSSLSRACRDYIAQHHSLEQWRRGVRNSLLNGFERR